MTKLEGRVIFDKLNTIYLDEARGYHDGWNDKKLAVDMGVPAAWISKIREQHFGPEFCEAEITDAVTSARAILEQNQALQKKIAADSAVLQADRQKLCEALANLQKSEATLKEICTGLARRMQK